MLRALSALACLEKPGERVRTYFLVYVDVQSDPFKNNADGGGRLPNNERMCYLALGEHYMFLVDHNQQQSASTDGKTKIFALLYTNIATITLDNKITQYMQLDLLIGALPSADDTLRFRCVERSTAVDELIVAIKTSYMYQTWKIHSKVLEREDRVFYGLNPGQDSKTTTQHNRAPSTVASEFIKPPEGEMCDEFRGCTYFRPAEYILLRSLENSTGGVDDLSSIHRPKQITYDTSKGESAGFLTITVKDHRHQNSLPPSTIQAVVEQVTRDICAQVADYRIIGRPGPYIKKMNLSGDLSSWTCWSVHLHTYLSNNNNSNRGTLQGNERFELRDVIILGARRSYIPPTHQSSCDFVVTAVSKRDEFYQGDTLTQVAERLVDSLSPSTFGFERDYLVLQKTADALLLEPDGYTWYASVLRIHPLCFAMARKFCTAIVGFLGIDETLKTMNAMDIEYLNTSTTTHGSGKWRSSSLSSSTHLEGIAASYRPASGSHSSTQRALVWDLAEKMENDGPGLSSLGNSVSDHAIRECWKVRLWKYLAYCVDGGAYPGVLTLDMLCSIWKNNQSKIFKSELGKILDALLYLRPNGSEYKKTSFAVKIADDRIARTCVFNDAVMVRYLESGYIQACQKETGDSSAYPTFLVRLLRRGDAIQGSAVAQTLRYAVLKRLVSQSALNAVGSGGGGGGGGSGGRDDDGHIDESSLNMLLDPLVELIKNHPQDEKLCVLCVACLVNFSRKNKSVKNKLLEGGNDRVFVNLLKSNNDDLLRLTCSLLTNLTKEIEIPRMLVNRERYDICPLLLSVLSRHPYSPHYRPVSVLSQACTVLGNLAIDSSARRIILDIRKVTNSSSSISNSSNGVKQAATGGGDKTVRFVNNGKASNGGSTVDEIDEKAPTSEALRMLARLAGTMSISDLSRDLDGVSSKEREVVQAAAVFALKNLCVSVASHVSGNGNGHGNAPPEYVRNVKWSMVKWKGSQLIRVLVDAKEPQLIEMTLKLLYVLCWDPKCALEFRRLKLETQLGLVTGADFQELVMQVRSVIVSHKQGEGTGQGGGGNVTSPSQ